MESCHVKSPTKKKEKTEEESRFSNLLQKNSDYARTCVISESSDSEEDKKNIRRSLNLNQYPNKVEIKDDKQAIVSQTGHYAKWNSEDFPSSSAMLKENKEKFNNTDITSKSIEDKHLRTPKKYNIESNKQEKNTTISDSDTDSPNSKYNGKKLSRKSWVSSDIRLNLKDLGLNKQLGSWIDFVQQKPVMSTTPVSFIFYILVDVLCAHTHMFKFKIFIISFLPSLLYLGYKRQVT